MISLYIVPDPLESRDLEPTTPPGTAIAELLEISITELDAGSEGDDILAQVLLVLWQYSIALKAANPR